MSVRPEPHLSGTVWRGMKIEIDERFHVVVGFDPMSVMPRSVYLEDVATGAPRTVTIREEPPPNNSPS